MTFYEIGEFMNNIKFNQEDHVWDAFDSILIQIF